MGRSNDDREKNAPPKAEQKWEYVNLDDFKSTSCWTLFAFGYLWVMLAVSVSVYIVDTFTAINLLAFDRWSGKVKPVIPFKISRWIYAGCIILSFLLLIYRWWRAIRVMQTGGVAKSYLDPLAVRIESIRTGEGRGWKRFLVFAELTKSRKGADYVALFAYFSFEAWLRICFAEGPRQVLNAITLYSVMRLNLLPQGQHAASDGHTPIVQFFVNVGVLWDSNKLQAVVLFGMLWTLVIWVISAVSLIVSVILYIIFLWHHIPSRDGGLAGYCRRKINRRLERIVKAKIAKAVKKENRLRAREEAKGGEFKRQPTLPNIAAIENEIISPLSRQTTMSTLPEYSSQPQMTRNSNDSSETLPPRAESYTRSRPPLARTTTHTSEASWSSFGSNAPLMHSAGEVGRSVSEPLQTPLSASPSPWDSRPPPAVRSMSGMTQPARPFSPAMVQRPGTSHGRGQPDIYQMEPLSRNGTHRDEGPSRCGKRTPSREDVLPPAPLPRRTTSDQSNPYIAPASNPSPAGSSTQSTQDYESFRTPVSTTNPYFPPLPYPRGRHSPGPSFRDISPLGTSGYASPIAPSQTRPYPLAGPHSGGRSITPARQPQLPRLQTVQSMDQGGYVPFSPGAQFVSSASPGPQLHGADRSVNRSVPPQTSHSYDGRRTYQTAYRQPSAPGLMPSASQQKYDSVQDVLDHY